MHELISCSSPVMNLIIAGRDTTAQALAWTFFHLLRHPELLAPLRAEADDVGKVDYDTYKTMVNTLGAFNEVIAALRHLSSTHSSSLATKGLRLHPSVPKVGPSSRHGLPQAHQRPCTRTPGKPSQTTNSRTEVPLSTLGTHCTGATGSSAASQKSGVPTRVNSSRVAGSTTRRSSRRRASGNSTRSMEGIASASVRSSLLDERRRGCADVVFAPGVQDKPSQCMKQLAVRELFGLIEELFQLTTHLT